MINLSINIGGKKLLSNAYNLTSPEQCLKAAGLFQKKKLSISKKRKVYVS